MQAIDYHPTPREHVDYLLSLVDYRLAPKVISDYSMGDGILLSRASERWPKAKVIGAELDSKMVVYTKNKYPDWIIKNVNFLSPQSRRFFNNNRPDLILLNPPFTCRGGSRNCYKVDGQELKSGPALAFVALASELLRPGGQLIAIIPDGAICSVRDRATLSWLKLRFETRILKGFPERTFKGCSISTKVISLRRSDRLETVLLINRNQKRVSSACQFPIAAIGRGQIRMTADVRRNVCSGKRRLLHTTSIVNGEIIEMYRFPERLVKNSYVESPAILIPRVGIFDTGKIVLLIDNSKMAISDCFIRVSFPDCKSASESYLLIVNNWGRFIRKYSGTGAKYITLASVMQVINNLGIDCMLDCATRRDNNNSRNPVKKVRSVKSSGSIKYGA